MLFPVIRVTYGSTKSALRCQQPYSTTCQMLMFRGFAHFKPATNQITLESYLIALL